MDKNCPKSGAGHRWRRYGSYRRKGDGKEVQRWQCVWCEQTTIQRPGFDDRPPQHPGPGRGHRIDHPEGYAAFRPMFFREIRRVGLYEALHVVAAQLGVHRLTVRRWVEEMSVSQVPSPVVAGALDIMRGSRAVPKVEGLDDWRGVWGWQHRNQDYAAPHTEDVYRSLRDRGLGLWQLLLRAASIACLVVGDPRPLQFRQGFVSSDPSVDELTKGGLLGRDYRDRTLSYWVSFSSKLAEKSSFGSSWSNVVTAMVCSRTRVLGVAESESINRLEWPSMTVRLDVDGTRRTHGGVLIPVPSATIWTRDPPLSFPLHLAFSRTG